MCVVMPFLVILSVSFETGSHIGLVLSSLGLYQLDSNKDPSVPVSSVLGLSTCDIILSIFTWVLALNSGPHT